MMYKPFRDICDFGKSQGLTVFGAVKVQCPVWVIHLKMKSKDNDPFFPVDRAMLRYMDMAPDANVAYLANLIGMDVDFIKYREKELRESNMICINQKGLYEITSDAKRKYFEDGGERPDVTIYGDVVVDGLSLKLLDKAFYEARAPYSDRRSQMIVPTAILSNDDPRLVKAVKRIEGMTRSQKEEYLLEGLSHDYEIEGYDLKSIDNVYIVLSYDHNSKKSRRDVFFRDRFIPSVDCLSEVIDHYYLYLSNAVCHSSEGYTPKDGNPFVWFSFEEVKKFLQERYILSSVKDEDFKCYNSSTPDGGYPLVVNVSNDMLERSEIPYRLMNDALMGKFDVDVKEGTFNGHRGGFCVISVRNTIPERVARYREMKDYVKRNGHIDMAFIEASYPKGRGWRQEFVELGLLEELEEIDIAQYIRYNGEMEEDYE